MKNYFKEGDLVTLNKEIPNKPVMMVYKIHKKRNNDGSAPTPFNALIGIECIWFTITGFIQREEFNFKDLESLEEDGEE